MTVLRNMLGVLCAGFALLVAGAGWTDAYAGDGDAAWREYRSAHFIVRSNAKPEDARRLVRDLEWYRHVVGRITNIDFSHDDTPPLRIWAWRTRNEYWDATEARRTLGFYNMGLDGPYSLMTIEPPEEPWQIAGRQVIMHEYTHHLIHQFSPLQYPRWYDEGFAEFMSTMEFGDGGLVRIGAPIPRAGALRDADWVPFRELLESKDQYMRQHRVSMLDPRRDRAAQQMQYAQGWITVHYLMTHPQRRRQIQTYLALMNRPDVSDEEAFEQAFQTSYKKLQKEVYEYFWSMKLPMLAVRVPDLPDVQITERELGEEEAAFQKYEGLLVAGDYGDTGASNWDRMVRLYEAGVRPQDMAYYLARTAVADDSRRDQAGRWIDAYVAAGGSGAVAGYLKAMLAMRDIFGEKRDLAKGVAEVDRDKLARLRGELTAAMRADPSDPRPHFYYCLTFAYTDDEKPDRQAMASIGIVRDRLPDMDAGAIVEAILLAKAGERDRALAQLGLMQRWAFSNEFRERLEKIAARVEKLPAAAAEDGEAGSNGR
ncbi:MAG: hypothetical protein KatS3mg119_0379 [Rhodothalassiaceae bacterium]|nr:MAG: hypothetical protein KatS3mg119_0379 [Rhodothalassiaceae bacterium]